MSGPHALNVHTVLSYVLQACNTAWKDSHVEHGTQVPSLLCDSPDRYIPAPHTVKGMQCVSV